MPNLVKSKQEPNTLIRQSNLKNMKFGKWNSQIGHITGFYICI